jgi:hypothetical protein
MKTNYLIPTLAIPLFLFACESKDSAGERLDSATEKI